MTEAADGIELDIAAALPGGFALELKARLPGRGVTAVFGPSGSGKTTLLRCLAGLQPVSAGSSITVGGELWQGRGRSLPAHRRPTGYVFQESSLFPHLTAMGNLRYALRRAPRPAPDGLERTVALMGIEASLERYPAQLSGGERQRVAIARALLVGPRLLLLDEPLASLDMARRAGIMPYLERLHREAAMPVVYVTHSLDEVARLADFLVVLDRGRAVAQGPLPETLSRLDLPLPASADSGVVLEAEIVERDGRWRLALARFPGGELWLPDGGGGLPRRVRARVLARDVSLSLDAEQRSSILNRLPATVAEVREEADGAMALVRLLVGPTALLARVSMRSLDQLGIRPGAKAFAQVKSVAVIR